MHAGARHPHGARARPPPRTSPASSPPRRRGPAPTTRRFPVPVRAADLNLPSVLKVPLLDGRWLDKADNSSHLRSVGHRLGARQAVRLPARRDPHDPAQQHQLRRGGRARPGRARPRARQRRLRDAVGGEERLRHRRQAQPALRPGRARAPPRRRPTPSPRPSASVGPTRRRPTSRATCCRRRPRPTRPCSRWPCSPACWRWPSGGSASPTSCRSR